ISSCSIATAPAIEALRAIIDELKADEGFASVSARLTGTVAMEHEEMLSVKSGAGLAALASLAMVLAVLYAALRSLRLVLIALVTLVAGLAATAAFAAAAVGHLNLLSVAFAVLYVGLGVDFIFHFCLRLKELLAAGRSLDDAIVETARGVGASLVVCTLTTAVAFYAFIPTDFDGVSELGLISGTGMLVSFAVSFTLLPALLGSPSIARGRHRVPPWVPTRALVPVAAHPRIVVAPAAAIAAGCAWLAASAEFNSNPIHLRDPSTESVRALLELAEDGQAPVYDLVAVAPDRATAARWAEALRALPEVRAVTTVDALVPKDQEQKLYLLEDLALVMGPGFADVERGELEPERLERALASLRADLAATGASAELADAIDAFLARLERLDAHDRRTVLAALDADLSAALPDELARLERALTAEPVTLESLPMPLAERWIAPDGRTLVEISPSENVNDNDAAARFVAAVRSVVPDVTGLPVVYQEASNTVVGAFRIAFALALVLITAMLFVFMKGVRDVLLVVVPLGFACVVTVGVTVLLDLPFNFANLITLPLIFGIGVDNGIHVVHRMRSDPPADGNPFGTSTSVAVLACALTTIASFGNLGFAAHRGIASMGQLLTLGMTLVLVSTLVF
ncbi:MAG: MMPL family transporter, partial [Gammaproteobacteria bacterium]